MICVGSKRDLLNSLRAIRGALDKKLARFPVEVVLVSLEQVGGDLPRFVFDLSTGNRTGGAGNRSAPAGIRSQSVGRRIGVALFDQDIANREAKLFGNDLRIRCFMPLALR